GAAFDGCQGNDPPHLSVPASERGASTAAPPRHPGPGVRWCRPPGPHGAQPPLRARLAQRCPAVGTPQRLLAGAAAAPELVSHPAVLVAGPQAPSRPFWRCAIVGPRSSTPTTLGRAARTGAPRRVVTAMSRSARGEGTQGGPDLSRLGVKSHEIVRAREAAGGGAGGKEGMGGVGNVVGGAGGEGG